VKHKTDTSLEASTLGKDDAYLESSVTDLFNPSDFQSTRLEIDLSNTTTNTEIKDGKKFFKGVHMIAPKIEIKITEFVEKGLVMEVPSKTCAQGHNVVVEIRILNPQGNSKAQMAFSFSGKVQNITSLDGETDTAEIRMVQFEEKAWQEFQSLYWGRQDEIDSYFQGMRG